MIIGIEAGCAECGVYGNDPLITIHLFDDMDQAKKHFADQKWLLSGSEPKTVWWAPHPQGGEHVIVGQGSVWLWPLPEEK